MIFSLFFSFCFTSLLMAWYYGRGLIEAAILNASGHRLTPGNQIVLGLCWFWIGLPVFLLIGGLLTAWVASRLPDALKNASPITALIVFAVMIVLQIGFARRIVEPALTMDKRLHLSTWPADLALTHFEVCKRRADATSPGRITVELLNRSSATLRAAVFTVTTGRYWSDNHAYATKLTVKDLPPNERRRVVIEGSLGRTQIVRKRGERPRRRGWDRPRIFWDSVRFDDRRPLKLTRHPVDARVHIDLCP